MYEISVAICVCLCIRANATNNLQFNNYNDNRYPIGMFGMHPRVQSQQYYMPLKIVNGLDYQ